MMTVRAAAVARFGPEALAPGEPVAALRRKFVPIWLLHRYQVEAATKLVGGVFSTYAIAGGSGGTAAPVDGASQRRALDAILATLAPSALDVPERLIPQLSGGWSGDSDRQTDIEVIRTAGSSVFDPLAAAEVAAEVTLRALLAPERLARLADQNRRDIAVPGPALLATRLLAIADAPATSARLAAVRRVVATRIMLNLAKAAGDPATGSDASNRIDQALADWATRQQARAFTNDDDRAWALATARLLRDREALEASLRDKDVNVTIPPGMPIGSD